MQTDNKTKKITIMREDRSQMPLLRSNFVWMIVAGILIVLGFILIAGSGSGIDEYNPDIFSTRRIVVGPLLSFLGFVIMGVAIIIKPKD
ncbi:MAG: DUF3098 domain-containing protein [Bacteroidales bacterium]|nr:DUF3098 domain-containing protein [Bacteroidales bacterium]